MEQVLFEEYGALGFGIETDQTLPVAGSRHVEGGFVVPALLGCDDHFAPESAPWVIPLNLPEQEIWDLKPPDIHSKSPMRELIGLMDDLQAEFGYVLGNFNCGGVLNIALDLRGNALYMDLIN